MIKWIEYNKDNPPLDGSYIARLDIPERKDNPGYNKMRIVKGECIEHYAHLITHYAEDTQIDLEGGIIGVIQAINRKTDIIMKAVANEVALNGNITESEARNIIANADTALTHDRE